MKTHSPPGAQVPLLFVKRMLSAKKVVPSLTPANGLSPAWLASRTSRSTTSPLAAAISRSCTPDPATANRPEPGVAQVTVTPAVRMVSSWVRPIIPWMAITAPGAAVAMAVRSPASSLTVTVGVAGQAAGAAAANDGPLAVGTVLRSWQPAATTRSRGNNRAMRLMGSPRSVRDVDGHVLVRPDVAGTAGRHGHTHHAPGGVGRGRGRDAAEMLPEPGEDHIEGPIRALLERAVGAPVDGDQPAGPAEREEVGIAAGVGREAELLAAAAQIAVRDQAVAAEEGAADERVALLDEIGKERLGAIGGASATDTQRTEDEPAAPAARIARRPRHKPVDRSGVAVRDEVRLVPRPTPSSSGIARGREAGSRPVGACRGCGRRVLARGERVAERQRGACRGKAEMHRCLLSVGAGAARFSATMHRGSAPARRTACRLGTSRRRARGRGRH